MIQIVITMDDAGNLSISAGAPPYVIIGLLAQAIALQTVTLSQQPQRQIIPGNGDLLRRLPPSVG